ncbi:hypothetical protein BTA51_14820 [Hahella sp. CCB-MM4]|uniref:LysR substrate-binding domain-containing protein n=1 Tax=Hahella sp. (strain CCB-MM4) TaxID=1926491 RepID=UPI000B9C6EBF|nr:LysR substrate-binding domain-containing protein [Hahella sp. CCB-MM4]OZG72790.1 hypothetical protein BTA51_14820 [Hahella sp. CCB-MM4]
MQSKPPPIQWLPVFESAARLMSFKKAAEELCVTPPAVSQQIKVLEEYVGRALFDRSGRNLKLTQAGEYYYEIVRGIIKSHQKGYWDFERTYKSPTLQISTPLFVAQELLIPNYMSFRERAPGIELRIMTGSEFVDFENESVDAAIRFGEGRWPDLDCRLLCKIDIGVVCSKSYLAKRGLDRNDFFGAAELQQQVLLSAFADMNDWERMIPDLQPADKIICDSYFSTIKSAEEGLGVAIGLFPIINRLLHNEHLIALNTDPFDTQMAYWLVAPEHSVNQDRIDLFYEWARDLFGMLF